ncbi:MAG: hypothetical protein LQ338_006524 [Usnochroma carphineum]|nr:MAG: hypothetical protein LQ338_006524 [Usnochroma carphineum]
MDSKIDTHCHFVPDFYREILIETGHEHVDGMPAIPPWDAEEHLAFMSRASISKSIISISSPGVSPGPFDEELPVNLAQQCNDVAADLKKSHPDKFGFWASLPLPNVNASLEELKRALDELDADGIGLLTNYHGHYLGSKEFDPVFAELNSRRATVFVHPSTPCIAAHNLQRMTAAHGPFHPIDATPLSDQYPQPMFEFLFDSTRAVLNLFLTGTMAKFPNIRYIIAHAGAALPPLIERNTRFNELIGLEVELTSQTVKDTFAKQFFFDIAGFPFPDQIHGLLRYVDASRLLYGSDYPFTPEQSASELQKEAEEGMKDLWPGEDGEEKRRGVWQSNAQKMLEANGTTRL